MPEVLTQEQLEKANAPIEVEFTVEQAKAFGYDDVAGLTAAMKAAGDRREVVEKMFPELVTAIHGLSKSMGAHEELKRKEIEEGMFDELTKSRFVEHFKTLPEGDTMRDDIKKHLLGEYPAAQVELALEGSALQKTLLRPLTARSKHAEEIREFRKCWDAVQIYMACKGGIESDGTDSVRVSEGIYGKTLDSFDNLDYPGIENVKSVVEKAMSSSAGAGGEWIPTILSSDFIDEVLLNLMVAPLFSRYSMPSPTFKIPTVSGGIRGYIIDENIEDTDVGDATPFFANLIQATRAGSGNIEFQARKMGALTFVSDEIQEDAIIPTMDVVYSKMARGMAESHEDWCINGQYGLSVSGTSPLVGFFDNAGSTTNRLWAEDPIGGPRDVRAMRDGLRVAATKSNVVAVDGNPSVDWANEGANMFRDCRKNMGKYGQLAQMDALAWIISLVTAIEMLKLKEVITLDKYGPDATILRGELGKFDTVPLIVSPFIGMNLDDLGFYTNGTAVTYASGNGSLTGQTSAGVANKTVALCVNKRTFAFGDRRTMRVESDRNAMSGQRYVLNTWRGDFRKLYATGDPTVGVVRNLRGN